MAPHPRYAFTPTDLVFLRWVATFEWTPEFIERYDPAILTAWFQRNIGRRA